MKDILLRCGDNYIECERNGLELTYTFSDEPKRHYVSVLRSSDSYEALRRELDYICSSAKDVYEGYMDACEFLETVDYHYRYFKDDTCYVYCDIRDREEIGDYLKEATDKVWLMRSCDIAKELSKPGTGVDPIKRILNAYDDIPKMGYDTWECGYWNGIMGALRWVLGDEKNFLDT